MIATCITIVVVFLNVQVYKLEKEDDVSALLFGINNYTVLYISTHTHAHTHRWQR